jgi:hypothetical protein
MSPRPARTDLLVGAEREVLILASGHRWRETPVGCRPDPAAIDQA